MPAYRSKNVVTTSRGGKPLRWVTDIPLGMDVSCEWPAQEFLEVISASILLLVEFSFLTIMPCSSIRETSKRMVEGRVKD